MKIIDYVPEHLAMITPQQEQLILDRSPAVARQLADYDTFTGIEGDRVIAIGGLVELNPDRAYLFLIVSEGIPYQWTKLYRAARRLILAGLQDYLRLETLSSFPEADRWLGLLGFEYEGTLRRAGPGGRDAKMFSIVRQ